MKLFYDENIIGLFYIHAFKYTTRIDTHTHAHHVRDHLNLYKLRMREKFFPARHRQENRTIDICNCDFWMRKKERSFMGKLYKKKKKII